MKFVKQHSWEQEWAETLRQEKAYLQKNLRKKDSALNRTLEERIPDTLQDTLDAAFAKAFALIFEKGTGVIERTYNKKREAALFQTHCAAVREQGDRRALRAPQTHSGLSAGKNLALSGVEGIGLGLLGIGLPDIPLFTAMILKSLYEIAAGYGYSHRTQEERRILLQLIRAALSYGEELAAQNRALDRYIGLGRWDDATVMRRQIDQTARSLSGELLYMKFLQGIPLAGAVGGAYDVIYLHRIQTYARMKYHKRFLLSRKNELAFYR